MKLRSRFPVVQHLFAIGCGVIVFGALSTAAVAQHKLTTKDGRSQVVTIVRVSDGNAQVQAGSNVVPFPLANIASVEMPAPADLATARAAMQAKDWSKALVALKPHVDKFRGLPADWVKEASVLLGDIYLGLGDQTKAEAAYNEFQKAYPGESTAQGDIGLARLAVAKKDYDTALSKLAPVVEKAGESVVPPPGMEALLSQALLLSGQVKEAKGDKSGALEDYLRTATIYTADTVSVAAARERADALRAKEKVVVP